MKWNCWLFVLASACWCGISRGASHNSEQSIASYERGGQRVADSSEVEVSVPSGLKLILCLGQSNMAGRGKMTDADRAVVPHAYKLNASNRWVQACSPYHFDKTVAGVGPVDEFVRRYLKDHPGESVGVVPCAVGGSSVTTWKVFRNGEKGKNLETALARAVAAATNGSYVAILWHQGETDAEKWSAARFRKEYVADVESVAQAVRKVTGEDVPFLAGEIGRWLRKDGDHAERVNPFTNLIPTKVPHSAVVSSEGLANRDPHHFTRESQLELGARYYAAWKDLAEMPREPFVARWKGNRAAAVSFTVETFAAMPKKGVVYRGIFVNDEDWSLRPWAIRHFGKEEQIGVRAYAEILKLMKANGLNLLWPAMHEGGYEFSSRPENLALAKEWGITIGTSHCEPMLRNNCYLPRNEQKKWSWVNNRDFMTNYWAEGVRRGAGQDILWTIGMRGIHDGRMPDGKTVEEKKRILEDVFAAQLNLLSQINQSNNPNNPTISSLFCPYKEVLPIYNAGLKVPEGTTIMWVNDNFGYIRRLGGPQCEGYPQGIYWHLSYHGRPHGYLHLCTTPPAFMWYELAAKAWQNGAKNVWMVNAGDVFQAELLLDSYGRLAADPEAWGTNAQEVLLTQALNEKLSVENEELRGRIVAHLNEYYALGFNRKPEHMCIQWTTNLPMTVKTDLLRRYHALLDEDVAIETAIKHANDQAVEETYFRLIGFQAQFLAYAGIIHLEGRDREYARSVLDPLHERWNRLGGGKWAGFWCDTIDETDESRQSVECNRWSSQMQWPWNEPPDPARKDRKGVSRNDYVATVYRADVAEPQWLEPAAVGVGSASGSWQVVKGLGTSGRARALLPVKPGVGVGATLSYNLPVERLSPPQTSTSSLVLQFLPDFALWPGLKLGVNVRFDNGGAQYVAVPKSASNLSEHDRVRQVAVQDNFIRVAVPVPEGAKMVTIEAVDPGVVIDRVGMRGL